MDKPEFMSSEPIFERKKLSMKKLLFVVSLFFAFSTSIAQLDPNRPVPIFDFDEVFHIELNITEEDYNQQRSADPSAMYHWTNVLKKHVRTEADLKNFWQQLEHLEYTEELVDPKYYSFFSDTIFKEKFCTFVKMTKGDSFYKDILVFKREGEVQGIAKLCMSCDKASFAPPTVFTDCFGEYKEFDRLREKGLFQ
jgi:hypothetical protein